MPMVRNTTGQWRALHRRQTQALSFKKSHPHSFRQNKRQSPCTARLNAALEPADAGDTKAFLRAWAWKREHRPDRRGPVGAVQTRGGSERGTFVHTPSIERVISCRAGLKRVRTQLQACPRRVRFHRPYVHAVGGKRLTVGQASFRAEGFASTVWDSSIVLAKYFERWSERYVGQRALDLSAGCGLIGADAALSPSLLYRVRGACRRHTRLVLVPAPDCIIVSVFSLRPLRPLTPLVLAAVLQGIPVCAGARAGLVLAALSCQVTATDLAANLPLLRSNYERNGTAPQLQCVTLPAVLAALHLTAPCCWSGLAADVVEHSWGTSTAALRPPFDVVVACGARAPRPPLLIGSPAWLCPSVRCAPHQVPVWRQSACASGLSEDSRRPKGAMCSCECMPPSDWPDTDTCRQGHAVTGPALQCCLPCCMLHDCRCANGTVQPARGVNCGRQCLSSALDIPSCRQPCRLQGPACCGLWARPSGTPPAARDDLPRLLTRDRAPGRADVMYIEAAAPALVRTLAAAAGPASEVLLAHGRNRQAEPAFLAACAGMFAVADVPAADLDPAYTAGDVRVLRLRRL
jgi:hypothetical protein